MIIIGGTFDDNGGKSSKIVGQLAYAFGGAEMLNGGNLHELKFARNIAKTRSVILWMPNVSNRKEKIYPSKPIGGVLFCTKVMREGTTKIDAVSRIFKMHANAVIAIDKSNKKYNFTLIDALGNDWVSTTNLKELSDAMNKLVEWSNGQIRIPSHQYTPIKERNFDDIKFINLVIKTADRIEASDIGRFFGNCSTRCFKTFPSWSGTAGAFVSARNIDKKRITIKDMIYTRMTYKNGKYDKILYSGDRKPSVDTGTQLLLYAKHPNVKYMIHGHTFVKGAIYTNHYYPCGDLREINDLSNLMYNQDNGVINLKQHGFLIYGDSLTIINSLVNNAIFI